MAIYREDIVNVELESGTIFRSFLNHTIGSGDAMANRFGVRVFRNGVAENIGGTCSGFFIRADGSTVVISGGTVNGNLAYVDLPEACYAVEGQIVKKGSPLIMVDGVKVMPETAKDAMINCGIHTPYFVLSVGPITLPWVLDEPMEDVISPANLPSFLKRMWNRLLGRDSKGISS